MEELLFDLFIGHDVSHDSLLFCAAGFEKDNQSELTTLLLPHHCQEWQGSRNSELEVSHRPPRHPIPGATCAMCPVISVGLDVGVHRHEPFSLPAAHTTVPHCFPAECTYKAPMTQLAQTAKPPPSRRLLSRFGKQLPRRCCSQLDREPPCRFRCPKF